jgi:hypothetical protein
MAQYQSLLDTLQSARTELGAASLSLRSSVSMQT